MNRGTKKRERKEIFFQNNPYCCFCGGEANTETIDHFPSRTIFDGRKWPEGYAFPACENCNKQSKISEMVTSFLFKIFPSPITDEQLREFQIAIDGLMNNRSDIMKELLSCDDPNGFYCGPLTEKELLFFANKLGCALHYKHTEQIISHSGAIVIPDFYTYADLIEGNIPNQLFGLVTDKADILYQQTSLKERFDYRYSCSGNKKVALFTVGFKLVIFFPIWTFADQNDVPSIFQNKVMKPFRYN